MTVNLRVKKKNIDSNAIDGSKVLFFNEHSFRAKKADGSEAELFKLNSSDVFQLGLLPRVAYEAMHDEDLTNKAYVDNKDNVVRADFAAADAALELRSQEYAEMKVAEEAAIRAAADTELGFDIAAESSTRASEDIRILSESMEYTDVEKARAMAAEFAESSTRASEDIRILSESMEYTDIETARAMAAEAAEAATRASEDARILSESMSYTDGEITSRVTSKYGQPSGIATLNAFGKLPVDQLPGIALTDVYVVTTLAERDALPVEEGDVAKVTEAVTAADGTKLARTYIYAVDNATQIGSWLDIVTESDVDSVNGKTGFVVLSTDDIAEGFSNKYFTEARAYEVVDTLADQFKCERKVLTAEDITNNYVELEFKGYAQSIMPVVDRLALIEEYDYTVSVVGGKTRLTFVGSLIQGGDEALSIGDRLSVRYLKDMRPRF